MRNRNAMANRLRQLRKEHGYSQTFVANKLGFSSSQRYANYEYGSNRISTEVADQLASLYGLTLDEFFYPKAKQNV